MIESILLVALLQSTGHGIYIFPTDNTVLLAQDIPAIEEEGFVFEFSGCKVTPNTDVPLTCEFLIENSRIDERRLDLNGRSGRSGTQFSRVIDANGNEIIASFVSLGNAEGSRYVSRDLPSQVPMKGTLSFNEAPEEFIRILDIGLYAYDSGPFDIEFRFSQ